MSQGNLAFTTSKPSTTLQEEITQQLTKILQDQNSPKKNLYAHAKTLSELMIFGQDVSLSSPDVSRFFGNVRSAIDGFHSNHIHSKVLTADKWLDFDKVQHYHDVLQRIHAALRLHTELKNKPGDVRATLLKMTVEEVPNNADADVSSPNECYKTAIDYMNSVQDFCTLFKTSTYLAKRMRRWGPQELNEWKNKVDEVAARFLMRGGLSLPSSVNPGRANHLHSETTSWRRKLNLSSPRSLWAITLDRPCFVCLRREGTYTKYQTVR